MPRSAVPEPPPIPDPAPAPRPEARGKWLWKGGAKHVVRGVTYGPFGGPEGRPKHASWEQDLDALRALGANTVRVYEPPSPAFLDLCAERDLGVFAGLAWESHLAFLSPYGDFRDVVKRCRAEVAAVSGHPAIDAWIVGNEVLPDMARFLGTGRVQAALEELVAAVRAEAGGALVAYANYPSTEYLNPRNADFVAFNLYLEDRVALRRYLARLGVLAGDRPLVVSEFGIDAGDPGKQRRLVKEFLEECEGSSVAGSVLFSFTDEWSRGGKDVEEWKFGLTDQARTPRPAAAVVKEAFAGKPPRREPLPVSVVVCSRNGAATLQACLDSLGKLVPPPLEVLVIDDGSTDATLEIAAAAPHVRVISQDPAGLSAARNRGAAEARGEIIAYTDDDCVADPEWLGRLLPAFDDETVVAAGGPNIPPPPRNATEAAVARAPGAPAHVLFDDTRAEHLPGCNLAVRKTALDRIGGFREQYHTAGDDVDFCWRLLEAGGEIRFVPAAFVWHHRRATVKAYFRQQKGYGRAEAMLYRDHENRFSPGGGGARWGGTVYGSGPLGALPPSLGRIYHGTFGNAPFQFIYNKQRYSAADFIGAMGGACFLFILLGAIFFPPVVLAVPLIPIIFAARWVRDGTPARGTVHCEWWRLLYLALAQPVVRSWGQLDGSDWKLFGFAKPERPRLGEFPRIFRKRLAFWSEESVTRDQLLNALLASGYRPADDPAIDLTDTSGRVLITTATEYHGDPRCLTRVRVEGRFPVGPHARRITAAAHSLGLTDAH